MLLLKVIVCAMALSPFGTADAATKHNKNSKSPKHSKKSAKSSKHSKKSLRTSCILPDIASAGQPVWVQTGQVMTQFEEVLVPRKRFPAKSGKGSRQRTIQNNDQYMVQCDAKTYLADQTCVVMCRDGLLDTTTYCGIDPEDVCQKARELTYIAQCPLDFDSDAPFHAGKSLKVWWKEVIDRFYSSGDALWNRTSDLPFYMGHGSAFLEGYGVAVQHFGHMPNVGESEATFEADIVDITGWVSEGYEYGPDTLTNSQTTPRNAYVDLEAEIEALGPFNLPRIDKPVNFPNPKLKTLSIIRNVYDPCDTNTFFGFSPECFLYHPAGYHVGNGKMLNFLTPLSNGEIDVLGVCTTMETVPPVILPPLMQYNFANVADYIAVTGGLIAVHPVSATLHLCIDEEDIYHPRLCPWHTDDDDDIDNINGDFVSVDARPFMPMPTAQRNMLCKKREANPGICDGPFDNITQPQPWTQYL